MICSRPIQKAIYTPCVLSTWLSTPCVLLHFPVHGHLSRSKWERYRLWVTIHRNMRVCPGGYAGYWVRIGTLREMIAISIRVARSRLAIGFSPSAGAWQSAVRAFAALDVLCRSFARLFLGLKEPLFLALDALSIDGMHAWFPAFQRFSSNIVQ